MYWWNPPPPLFRSVDPPLQYSGTAFGEPTHTASKQWHCVPHLRIYCLKRKTFRPLYSSMNQQHFSAIKITTMKITDDFSWELKPSCVYHKIDTFCGEARMIGIQRRVQEEFIVCTGHSKRHYSG